MAITRIRGGQIHDRTILGIKIAQGVLSNEHIAAGAEIDESKLNIDWEGKGVDILSSKKVIDYIQVSGTVVDGLNSVNVTALNIFGGSTPTHAVSDPDLAAEGIIIDAPKNKVALRDSVTGDPILDSHGHEVFGRMTYDDGNSIYVLKFYTEENGNILATPVQGIVEVEFTMPDNQIIDWQYAQRFNLQTVNEMFAANEKFVEGAADATAHLNIEQLAKDLYGGNFTLGRDGNARLVKSVIEQVSDETSRAQIAEATLQDAINDEIQARAEANTLIRNDLISQLPGKGASVVGIQDNSDNFTSTTVEGALKELSDRATALESGTGNSNTEILEARDSSVTGTHGSLNERLNSGEARYELVKSEVEAARAGQANLDTRLDEIDNEISELVADLAQETSDRNEAVNTVQTSLDNEITRATTAEGTLQTIIEQEIDDRIDAINEVKTDLSDTTTGKGASLIGVDSTKGLTGVTVEAVLENLNTNLNTATSELDLTHNRASNSANGMYTSGTFTGVVNRIVDIETKTDASKKTIEDAIATESDARQTADTEIINNLAAVTNGKGASLVGIEDASGKFTATTVEEALGELKIDVATVQTSIGDYTTLNDARIAVIEGQQTTQDSQIVAVSDEVQGARGSKTVLADRLNVSINADGTLKVANQIHVHKKYITTISANTTVIEMPEGEVYVVGDGSLNVYVNGILQANNINFDEVAGGASIDFGTDELLGGDVVVIEYVVYGVQS
ncbi:hypothetical protein D3C71_1080440 [compost metagenome]